MNPWQRIGAAEANARNYARNAILHAMAGNRDLMFSQHRMAEMERVNAERMQETMN